MGSPRKGLADTINRLGSDRFARLRIGIGRPPADWDAADYVLGRFAADERSQMDLAVARAAKAVEVWIGSGVQEAMNQFNADPQQQKKENLKNELGDRHPSVAKTDRSSAKSKKTNLDDKNSTEN